MISALSLSFCQGMSVTRRMEDTYVDTSDFEYDLSSFSIKFEKCQYVKSFDDELAESNKYDTVLATKQFVVFKICPSDECDNCNGVHGEYVADIEDYLSGTVANEQAAFEYLCDNCNEYCSNNGDSCTGCGKSCYDWATMEANGYVDASQYITCQKTKYVRENNNDNNDNGGQNQNQNIYVGPMCGNDGKSIAIGLFADKYCWEPVTDLEIEDVLGYKLSYQILDSVISSSTNNNGKKCLSCMESTANANANDQADGDTVNEMCEEVYDKAAKCESIFGLENGFVNVNRKDKNYENQVENEFMSCTFIKSLIWNSYTETGEINYMAVQDEIIREVTKVQALALTCLSVFFVTMLAYGVYLHNAIKKEYPGADLQYQSDGVLS